jgi:hypothetical protein
MVLYILSPLGGRGALKLYSRAYECALINHYTACKSLCSSHRPAATLTNRFAKVFVEQTKCNCNVYMYTRCTSCSRRVYKPPSLRPRLFYVIILIFYNIDYMNSILWARHDYMFFNNSISYNTKYKSLIIIIHITLQIGYHIIMNIFLKIYIPPLKKILASATGITLLYFIICII